MKIVMNQKGQLLIEILLAILVAVLLVGAASNLIFLSLKGGQVSGSKNVAISLAREGIEAIESIRDSSWHNIYLPPDGTGDAVTDKGDDPANVYYIFKSGSTWALTKNPTDGDIAAINGIKYTRTIKIYNAKREGGGDRNIDETSGIDDPSTQKIKVTVSYPGGQDTVLEEYITRWRNNAFIQSGWAGGSGITGPLPANIPATEYESSDASVEINAGTGAVKLKQ